MYTVLKTVLNYHNILYIVCFAKILMEPEINVSATNRTSCFLITAATIIVPAMHTNLEMG